MRISDWSSDVCSSDLTPVPSNNCSFTCVTERTSSTSVSARSSAIRRSEERRVGKRVSVRVDLGGSRIIKKKKQQTVRKYVWTYMTTELNIERPSLLLTNDTKSLNTKTK